MAATFKNGKAAGFYFALAAGAAALLAVVTYILNAMGNYYNDLRPDFVIVSAVTLLLLSGSALSRKRSFGKLVNDLLVYGAVAAIMISLCITLSMRVQSIAYILFSDLESGNEVAQAALRQYFFVVLFYLLSVISLIVSGSARTGTES